MLTYRALVKQIAEGKFAPIYLFFGEEKYLQEDLVARLEASFLGDEPEFSREKVDGLDYSLEEILDMLGESSLFSQKKLIIVENPPYLAPPRKNEEAGTATEETEKDSRGKAQVDMLDNYLDDQGKDLPESILVFTAPGVDRRKRLFKLLEKKGIVVECSPLKGDALVSWVRHKAGRLGKKIDRAAVEKLLMTGDHNLHYLSRELEKYCSYLGSDQDTITAETVDHLFSGDLQSNVFKLADALAEGNIKNAGRLLDLLLKRREQPLLIFFMLVRHYRLLLQAHSLLEEGLSQQELTSALKVHNFVARKLKQQASFYNRTTLEDVLIALQESDLQFKTGQIEPEKGLQLVLSRVDYIQKTGTGLY